MAKGKVLGNDPFLRGAASRAPAKVNAPQKLARPPKTARTAKASRARKPASPLQVLESEPATDPVADNASGPEARRAAPRPREEVSDSTPLAEGVAAGATPLLQSALETWSEALRALWAFAAGPGSHGEVDDLGEDPAFLQRLDPALRFLCRRYFRTEVRGAENLPGGRALLICNHSGALPLDGPMLRMALSEFAGRKDTRWLVEDAVFYAPFMGMYLNRLGAVRACPENAELLLQREAPVGVFPEGLLGIGKPYRDRYKLQRFGRGGFAKIAIRTNTPVIPVAIVGAEEALPLLAKLPGSALGVPYLPVTPTFPLLGLLGLLPLPTKWVISLGKPIDLAARAGGSTADAAMVQLLADEVRGQVQRQLDEIVANRSSPFKG